MTSILDNFKEREFTKVGRSNVISADAMLATSHPIAGSVGINILKSGGNAVDAALAMNAVLCISEPHMTGVGGDCFAMLSVDGGTDIKALNGSGKSSENASARILRDRGLDLITAEMPDAITIPGAVAGWQLLHNEYGHMPWKEIFQPAIKYARSGIFVHEKVALDWSKNVSKLMQDNDTANLFLQNEQPFKFMDKFLNPRLAETFELIAEEKAEGFYNGWVAHDIQQKLLSIGGNHTLNDFCNANAEWVKPITGNYRNIQVHECPPNGQGIVALIILAILEKYNPSRMSKADYNHLFCEAVKIGYYLRDKYLSEPKYNKLSVKLFLSSKILEDMISKIDMGKAKIFSKSDFPDHPDTIYLTVRDKNGMTISFINSLFDAFGSAITAPKSGVLLHCRGRAFNLIDGHPNELNPNKRPLHTIIPAMISEKNSLIGSFGVMGGQYQAAGHAYVLSQMIDFGLNPQDALNYPRIFPTNGFLDVESDFDKKVVNELSLRGHKINDTNQVIGGGQMIMIDNDRKILVGASDWRKDGFAIGY
mgnify:FL=1